MGLNVEMKGLKNLRFKTSSRNFRFVRAAISYSLPNLFQVQKQLRFKAELTVGRIMPEYVAFKNIFLNLRTVQVQIIHFT